MGDGVRFSEVKGWLGDGVEVWADFNGCALKLRGQVIIAIRAQKAPLMVMVDQAIIETLQQDGTYRQEVVTKPMADSAARNMALGGPNGSKVSIGETFTKAWNEHLRLFNEAAAVMRKTLVG